MSSKRSALTSAAEDIPDRDVDGQPHIKTLLSALERLQNAHAAPVSAVTTADRQIAGYRAIVGIQERRIAEAEDVQKAVALGCCIQGKDEAQKQWLDAESAIQDARRVLAQHRLAEPAFVDLAKPPRAIAGNHAAQIEDLNMGIAAARWEAKLALAEQQNG